MSSASLPPGRRGLPLVGETLSFAKNPFRFIDERLARHGKIFRSFVLGRETVVLAGPDAAGAFIDPDKIMREGSMPPHVQELFGGRSLPLLDGAVHRERKGLVMRAFDRGALESYLPVMQVIIERYFVEWSAKPEIRWVDEMKRLSIEVICTTIIGMRPGAELDRLREDYGTVTGGFATLPIAVPGTRYHKALKARDRILDVLLRRVRDRRRSPAEDGLSRILGSDPNAISDEDAALEVHHIVIAGFIVFGELISMVQQLALHPDVRARVAEEVAANLPAGALPLTSLHRVPYVLRVVNEVRRLSAIVPVVFGRSKRAFDFDGATIPAGWMVMWALTPSHVAMSQYSEPTRFDPDRFGPERAEDQRHPHAFAPQGAGPATGHRCAGFDFTTYFMETFAIVLVRGYEWELPQQRFDLDFSKTPPEPKDGLRATVRRRS